MHVADDRDDEPVWRIYRDADVDVLFENDVFLVAGEGRVHLWQLLQRGGYGFHYKNKQGELDAGILLGFSGVEFFAQRLEVGDVDLVPLCDMGDAHPVPVQVRAGQFFNLGELLLLGVAELVEVHLRPRQQAKRIASASSRLENAQCFLDVILNVLFEDAALPAGATHLGQVHSELAGHPAHRGGGVGVFAVVNEAAWPGNTLLYLLHRLFGGRLAKRGSGSGCAWLGCSRQLGDLHDEQRRVGADGVAGCHLDFGDFDLVRRRHFHGGLVALDTDDRLFLFDLIAHGHVDIGHVDRVSADIRQGNFLSDDHRFSRLFFLVSWLGFDRRRIALGGIEH